ncbi:MAG: imidazole glycerol phosphate synthase subunit HisH [Thaumarchaeota archaeon]|nr:imidazole glycerol phosphate synthase subunit HisH [Nitrososphaerota archaeon]
MLFKIFNYGAGNLFSIQSALKKEGVAPSLTKTGAGMEEADALILPGVGSFDQAARALPMARLRDQIASGKPVLGICLGLQLFFATSEEGSRKGFALLEGTVRRFPASVKVPQIGWNTLDLVRSSRLAEGVPTNSWVYYVNSYYPETRGRWVAATSTYGLKYAALIEEGNIYGTQFHPEKSGPAGRMILKNFVRAVKR